VLRTLLHAHHQLSYVDTRQYYQFPTTYVYTFESTQSLCNMHTVLRIQRCGPPSSFGRCALVELARHALQVGPVLWLMNRALRRERRGTLSSTQNKPCQATCYCARDFECVRTDSLQLPGRRSIIYTPYMPCQSIGDYRRRLQLERLSRAAWPPARHSGKQAWRRRRGTYR
jgi:hypothetical protein